MARPPRLVIAGTPLHVVQRGVDRCPTFLTADDFAFYQWALREASVSAGCGVHAYVLMTNHVHLLVTPNDADGAARLMCALGRRYVRYFNDRYRRTGTLWEGRFRSGLIASGSQLFGCSRYIELNPVRAGMVDAPEAYEWSSFRHNAHGADDPLVAPHPDYLALAAGEEARRSAYRTLFATELEMDVIAALRAAHVGRGRLYQTSYRRAVEAVYGSDEPDPAASRTRLRTPSA